MKEDGRIWQERASSLGKGGFDDDSTTYLGIYGWEGRMRPTLPINSRTSPVNNRAQSTRQTSDTNNPLSPFRVQASETEMSTGFVDDKRDVCVLRKCAPRNCAEAD